MPRPTFFRIAALLLLILPVGACGTLMQGPMEEISIKVPNEKDAICTFTNHLFFYEINPPRRFQIERSDEAYHVVCRADGNRRISFELPVDMNKLTLLNGSNGFAPGMIVDLASGAYYRYPNEIVVDFSHTRPEPNQPPAYQQVLQANPLMKGMEEFRPGEAAIMSDENDAITPMQKHKDGDYENDSFGLLSVQPSDIYHGSDSGSSSGFTSSSPSGPSSGGSIPAKGAAAQSTGAATASNPIMRHGGVPNFDGSVSTPNATSFTSGAINPTSSTGTTTNAATGVTTGASVTNTSGSTGTLPP